MEFITRVIKRAYAALEGLKTYITAAAVVLVGLAEYLQVINLRPILVYFFGEDAAELLSVVILPLTFAGLRYVTKSPPKPASSIKGDVDVPEGEA